MKHQLCVSRASGRSCILHKWNIKGFYAFGMLSDLTDIVGILLSVVVWMILEGSVIAGSTDIGVVIIYVLVFVGLFLFNMGPYYGITTWLSSGLRRWG